MAQQLTIGEAAAKLVVADTELGNWMGIGVARIGSEDQLVVSAKLGKLQNQDFGRTPHSLVIPGRLHFMEVESLRAFCGASDADLEALK
jgi:diphthamide biosynthesis methyltransferase